MSLSTEGLARSSAAKPWLTIGIWIVLTIVGVALAGTLLQSATTEGNGEFTVEPESEKAQALLEESGLRGEVKDTEIVLIRNTSLTVDSPEFIEKVNEIHSEIVALGSKVVLDPQSVINPLQAPDEVVQRFGLISDNRDAVRIPVTLAGELADVGDTVEPLLELAEEESSDGFTVGVFGAGAIGADFREISESDLIIGEAFGLAVAFVILLVVLRAFGSVWIPLVLAIMGIGLATGTISIIGQFYEDIPFFATNFITMIGLAVGIDYTLFIVARYREERARGLEKIEAVARSSSTASRAVLFSGVTVVFALVGMLIVPTTIFFSMALSAILVVIFTVLLALTFLPALLALLGDKVNAWQLPFLRRSTNYDDTTHGFWNRMTRMVLKQPVLFLVVTFALLVALTIPYFNINLGFNGVETFPDEFRAKETFEILQTEFPRGQGLGETTIIEIVVEGDAGSQAVADGLDRLVASLESDPIFGDSREYQISDNGEVGLLELTLGDADDPDLVTDFIHELREDYIPAANIPGDVYVGGMSAFNVDFFDLVNTWAPIVVGVVLALSFVLLTIVFRSLIVPVKAIILNLLSVGAAYGLLVLVFQEGVGADILGFQQVPVVEAWIPLFLFAVLFGLSMDYEVFLLSRIREHYDQTHDNDESVAFGLRSTAGIITGAALIMVAVFTGFALGDLVMFQQFGFGLAVAVLVDATIIRSILVPSTMKLLGHRNWWLPSFLSWLPDVRVEGGEPARVSPAGAADGD